MLRLCTHTIHILFEDKATYKIRTIKSHGQLFGAQEQFAEQEGMKENVLFLLTCIFSICGVPGVCLPANSSILKQLCLKMKPQEFYYSCLHVICSLAWRQRDNCATEKGTKASCWLKSCLLPYVSRTACTWIVLYK